MVRSSLAHQDNVMALKQLEPLDDPSLMMSHLQQCVTALTSEMDEESQSPTEAALGQARSILSEVSTWHAPPAEHSLPSISTVGDGDLIVEWRGERKAVLLFLLPIGTCRLQQVDLSEENLSVSEVARNPSARQVAASLAWLGRSQAGDQAQ